MTGFAAAPNAAPEVFTAAEDAGSSASAEALGRERLRRELFSSPNEPQPNQSRRAIEKKIQELERRLRDLRTRFTTRHPDVVRINKTLANLRDRLATQPHPADERRDAAATGPGPAGLPSPTLISDGTPITVPQAGEGHQLIGGLSYRPRTAFAFDSRNRPYLLDASAPEAFGDVLTLREGRWVHLSYLSALRTLYPTVKPPPSRRRFDRGSLTIDEEDAIYAIVPASTSAGRRFALLYSPEGDETFRAYELPSRAFLETRVGPRQPTEPPAIGLLEKTKPHPARWVDYHRFSVLLPQKTRNGLKLGHPIEITRKSFGISNHSGGFSFAVTTGSRTHLVYAEIPENSGIGNPTFAATLDRRSHTLVAQRKLVDAQPQVVNVHATPVIATDGQRRLHVLAGSHNGPFFYLRSQRPDDITQGWTSPVSIGKKRTYATLVVDDDGWLHSVSRRHPVLLHESKGPAAPIWGAPSILVQAPQGHSGYTIFYHRLGRDRKGNLYLSFTFYTHGADEPGLYPRVLLTSHDGGVSWELATKALFEEAIRRKM